MAVTDTLPARSDPPDGPPGHTIALDFADLGCLRGLRRWLGEHVHADPTTVQGSQLVCTELVSNALDHGGGHGHVRITAAGGHVHIEVRDEEPDTPLTPGTSRLGRYRGRGLAMIGKLAEWGVRRTATSKTVWATL